VRSTIVPTQARPTRRAVVAVVIPTYRAAGSVANVVAGALEVADFAVVVDDACPDRSGACVEPSSRVIVVTHERNLGVGGATKTGIAAALRAGADYVVKLDADGQMDPAYVPDIIALLEQDREIDMVKGNRFADPQTMRRMPIVRLIGNSILTLLIKFSSGYWTIVDPTNGYIAVRASALRETDLGALANRYFFEIDLLCSFGLRRLVVAELKMPAIYGGERSSLSIPHVLLSFPLRLLSRFVRRIVLNYFVVEINVGSLCGAIGLPMFVFAVAFGAHEWGVSVASGIPRPTGTVILALLLFMIGFQLSLQALLYDVQFAVRTLKFRRAPDDETSSVDGDERAVH
jgi:glycosyltransferase involved in cell wall biosynthesis